MLIAEDLLLLLTDDATGRLAISGNQVDVALAGANLIELTLMERVDLAAEGEQTKAGRVVVRDASPTEDPLLDSALAELTKREGKKPSAVINPLSKRIRSELYARLTARGILRAEHGKILGIFPTKSWSAQEAGHENALRHEITNTLMQGTTPEPRIASLVSLLHALKAVHKVVDPKQHGVRKSDLNSRAKEIAEGNWGSKAVRQAVDEMTAAVMIATTAAISASAASAGSS